MCPSTRDDHGRQKSCLLSLSLLRGHKAQTSGGHTTVGGREQDAGSLAESPQHRIFKNLMETVQLVSPSVVG